MDSELKENYVKLGVFDIDGLMRGKYINKSKINNNIDFCSVILGWDINDQVYDQCDYTGWHTGYHDASLNILTDTRKFLPDEQIDFYLCEFAGDANEVCPRSVLKNILAKYKDCNLTPQVGFEYEFFLFDETPLSIRQKKYQDLTPISPGNCGYSVLRSNQYYQFYHQLLKYCHELNIPIEGIHTETGPGVIEAAIKYSDALSAADNAGLFKTFTKSIAHKFNYLATFMARWNNNLPGQSGHLHISLLDNQNTNIFYDDSNKYNISKTMSHFMAGQQRLMPELLALIAPTINSYTRLVPGYWAPTHATIGIDNRTCALRVIPRTEKSHRLEYRVTGAEVNPYIALSVALASGLWGIEQELEPIGIVQGNAYDAKNISPDLEQFSSSLAESVNKLKSSTIAKDLFGEKFINHFCSSREWEIKQYNKQVTNWQLERYFELI